MASTQQDAVKQQVAAHWGRRAAGFDADFGAATFGVDLASMAHETQYSRLFRS